MQRFTVGLDMLTDSQTNTDATTPAVNRLASIMRRVRFYLAQCGVLKNTETAVHAYN